MIGEGDKVAARWTLQATHTGDFPGFPPPTGKTVHWSGMSIYHIANGIVTSETGEEDALSFLQQLGAIPTLAHATT